MSKKSSKAKVLTETKPCVEETQPTIFPQPATNVVSAQADMARVITQLDRLQASIDHLLNMCLQEGPEDSSGVYHGSDEI